MAADKDPELSFATKRAFDAWLAKNHATARGVRMVLAKKGSARKTITYAEAVDVALAWGWIDAQKGPIDDLSWLQRFTPRTAKSGWSKINRDKAMALIESGAMQPPGLAEVERAKKDGRWNAAYDSPRAATVPEDLQAALDANESANNFFASIDGANRYAILYRVQTAKKPETRAERIEKFVEMLAKGETIHPARKKQVVKPPAASRAATRRR